MLIQEGTNFLIPGRNSINLKWVGSTFERESDESDWYSVDDFEMEDDYMVTLPLIEKWEIMINNLFDQLKEETGNLFFTTGDRSVRVEIWNNNKICIAHNFKVGNQCIYLDKDTFN